MPRSIEQTVKALIADSNRPETEQERVKAELLATLDQIGGKAVGEDDLIFEGNRIVLPESMRGNVQGVVRFLLEWDEQQNTPFSFNKKFNYRPYDGAAAFDRTMKRLFGTTGIGRAQVSMFGSRPPAFITVPSGPGGQTIQVPWGDVELPFLEANFHLGMAGSEEYGVVFAVSVTAPRRHRKRIEGFFAAMEQDLKAHSIYKGHAITAAVQEVEFLDTSVIDPSKVIYRPEVLTQLRVNLWSPIRDAAELQRLGISLKRAVLLEGPNGTGKTLAGNLTSRIAEENGWTYILCRAGDNPFDALKTAAMYAPAVVWIEDLERYGSAKKDNEEITRLLDALDSVQSKGVPVMAGFTSNFAGKLVKDVVRPGRLDAIIEVSDLDADGYRRLVKALIPADLLDPEVDFAAVSAAYEGMLPSFAKEAAERAIRYSVARNDGVADLIKTSDLVEAAQGMQAHLDMMNRALTRGEERPVLDQVLGDQFREAVTKVLTGHKVVDGDEDEIGHFVAKNRR